MERLTKEYYKGYQDGYKDCKAEMNEKSVLDKIRAEIEDLTYYCCEVHPRNVIDDVLEILDKCRAESEDKK